MTVIEYKSYLEQCTDEIIATINSLERYLLKLVGLSIVCWKKRISPFDEYEKVKDIIENDTKWRQSDGTYRKST